MLSSFESALHAAYRTAEEAELADTDLTEEVKKQTVKSKADAKAKRVMVHVRAVKNNMYAMVQWDSEYKREGEVEQAWKATSVDMHKHTLPAAKVMSRC